MNNGKTISNSSSVKYNILNHENDKFAIKYSDKIFNNMRKQLTGFYERGSLFNNRRDFNYGQICVTSFIVCRGGVKQLGGQGS